MKLLRNFSQNIVRPVLHFVVPESQRTKSALGEHGAAHRIELDSVSMPTTIDFDDEAGRNTDEVDNVAVDGNLSAKLKSAQAARTQACPQQAFRIRLA